MSTQDDDYVPGFESVESGSAREQQASGSDLAAAASDSGREIFATPRPASAPQPRVLTYPRDMVIGRQTFIFGVPIAIFSLISVFLLPVATRNPCNGIFILAVLGGVGYGCVHLYAFLRRFAVHPACPYCGKALSSDLTWVCGYCDTVHNKPYFFSVFLRCKRCGRKPKAYKCHYPICGKIVYFDLDFDATHGAYAPGHAPPRVSRVEDNFEEQWELDARAREQAIKIAGLEADYYDQMKRRAESHKQFEKAKLPSPAPVDPVQAEIGQLLKKLNSRVAKQDALDAWHRDRQAEIKAKGLPASEENHKLKDLDHQVRHVKATL